MFFKEGSRDLSTLLLVKIFSSPGPRGFEPRKIGFSSLFLAKARALTSSRVDFDDVIPDDVTGLLRGPFLGLAWITVGRSEYCSDSSDVIDIEGEPANIRCTDGGLFEGACSEILVFPPTESLSGNAITSFVLSLVTGELNLRKSWDSFGLSLGEGLGESLAPSGPYSPGRQCTFLGNNM